MKEVEIKKGDKVQFCTCGRSGRTKFRAGVYEGSLETLTGEWFTIRDLDGKLVMCRPAHVRVAA